MAGSNGNDFDGIEGFVNDDDSDGNPDVNIQVRNPIDRAQDALLVNVMFDDDDSDDEDFEGFNANWVITMAIFALSLSQIFRCRPVLKFAKILHPPEARAIDYFELFFTDEIWIRMVDETNRYAEQQPRSGSL